jgi:hypothetical protein
MTNGQDDYGSDEFYGEEMSGLEQKHQLERTSRVAVDIEQAIAKAGPLAGYMKDRRRLGLDALAELVSIDPANAIGIAQAQAVIQEYLNVRTWVLESIQAGNDAKTVLKEEFGDDEEGRGTDHDED